MKVYITGIAGFIGFHLANNLLQDGHEVVGIDNFNDYYDPAIKFDRAKFLYTAGASIHKADIREFDEGLLNNIDVIIHLACWPGVRASLDNKYTYIDNNINGTQRIVDAAEKKNIPVVYASSSSVYKGQTPPFTEDIQFFHHSNPYSWSKYVNECQFMNSSLPASIGFRFFTVYGEYGRPDMALHSFTEKILNDEQITVFGHGEMSRDFTHVSDIVQGIKILIDEVFKINTHEIYNIGTGEKVPLMDFVHLIEKNVGKKADIKFEDMHPADVRHTLSDLTKISKLGYKPQNNIKQGIKSFVGWFQNYYQ